MLLLLRGRHLGRLSLVHLHDMVLRRGWWLLPHLHLHGLGMSLADRRRGVRRLTLEPRLLCEQRRRGWGRRLG